MSPTLHGRAELMIYLGVVPFAVCLGALALWPTLEGREVAQRISIAWGAVVLAFAGAVHWGLALAGHLSWRPVRIAGSVAPAVIAVIALQLRGQHALALLVVGLGVFWLYEHKQCAAEIPASWLNVRRNLTVAVCALLALTMISSESVGLG